MKPGAGGLEQPPDGPAGSRRPPEPPPCRTPKLLQPRRSYVDQITAAPISLWEQDFSAVGEYIRRRSSEGVVDFHRHFHEHPEDVVDLSGKVVFTQVNAASLAAFRQTAGSDFQAALCAVTDRDSYMLLREQFIALAGGRLGVDCEPLTLSLQEKARTLLVRMVATPGNERALRQVFTAVIDISSTALQQQRQEAGVDKYRALFEAASEAMLLTDAATGIIVEANRQAEQLVEMPGQGIAGLSLKRLLPLVADDYGGNHRRDYCETFVTRQRSRVQVPVAVSTSLIKCNGAELALSILRELRPDGAAGLPQDGAAAPSFDGARVHLTAREKEILRLIVAGNTSKEIGEKLRLSPKTVETHRSRSMRKLNLHNTAALVKHVLIAGLE